MKPYKAWIQQKERQKQSKDLEGEFYYYLLTQQRATTTEVLNNRAMFYENTNFRFFLFFWYFNWIKEFFFTWKGHKNRFFISFVRFFFFWEREWCWEKFTRILCMAWGMVTSCVDDFLTCRILLFCGNLKVDVKVVQLIICGSFLLKIWIEIM